MSNVIAISAGQEHSQALLRDGRIVVWGNTNHLAISTLPGALTNSGAAVATMAAGWLYGVAVKSNATVVVWGQVLPPPVPNGLTNVWLVSAGSRHSLALVTNNLPVINQDPKSQEVGAGTYVSLNVVADGTPPLTYQWEKSDVAISGATNSTLAFASFQSTNAGTYRARVSNAAGTAISREAVLSYITHPVILSQSMPLFTNLLRGSNITLSIVATNNGSAAMTNYWFQNGQPLLATTNRQRFLLWNLTNAGTYQVIVSNSAGTATSLVWTVNVISPGQAVGWGYPAYELGITQTEETDLVALAASVHDSMGLRENGTVFAWGFNTYGQTNVPTGLTNVTAIAAGVFHSLALRENGSVVAWGDNLYGQTNVPASATNIIAIAGGGRHSLALRNTGRVLAWGDDAFGATTVPSDITNAAAIAAGSGFSLALLSNGTVRLWGAGQLTNNPVTLPSGLSNVVAVTAGYTHGLALKADGLVVGFGLDFGYGATTPPAGLDNVLQIAAGYRYSVALKNDGTVVAWGDNYWGQTNAPSSLGGIKLVAAGIWHALALVYDPVLNYPVNISQDLLLLYNTNSADSTFVKDYYLAKRPLVGGANVLGLNCAVGEFITTNDFVANVRGTLNNWYAANPTKRPEHMILFLDVPSRISDAAHVPVALEGELGSVSYQLWRSVPGRKPYITHINMGATGTNDCVGYINKLANIGTNYSPGKVIISASRGGYGNTNYLMDNIRYGGPTNFCGDYSAAWHYLGQATNAIVASAGPSQAVLYHDGLDTCPNGILQAAAHPSAATNVAGYVCWGVHSSLQGHYAFSHQWRGNSGWWIIETIESYNGQRSETGQVNFIKWFSSSAFGGTNYSNTPVGAVTHVEEPGLGGVNNVGSYFSLWAAGRKFSAAAWRSRNAPVFQAIHLLSDKRTLNLLITDYVPINSIRSRCNALVLTTQNGRFGTIRFSQSRIRVAATSVGLRRWLSGNRRFGSSRVDLLLRFTSVALRDL